jgi:hypothetical protein
MVAAAMGTASIFSFDDLYTVIILVYMYASQGQKNFFDKGPLKLWSHCLSLCLGLGMS